MKITIWTSDCEWEHMEVSNPARYPFPSVHVRSIEDLGDYYQSNVRHFLDGYRSKSLESKLEALRKALESHRRPAHCIMIPKDLYEVFKSMNQIRLDKNFMIHPGTKWTYNEAEITPIQVEEFNF